MRPRGAKNSVTDALPLVSVVIPCYNATRTLSATLNSVLHQTWPAIEVLAVDDRSTDGTLDLLHEHEAAFGGRLRVIGLEQNRGSAGARNAGIEAAHGRYLALLDSDDVWSPDKTTRQVTYLEEHADIVFVGCKAQEFQDDGIAREINADRKPTIGPDAWRMMLRYPYFVPSMVMTRMDEARAIGGFDIRRYVVDDQDFLIRLALRGPVGMIDDTLVTMGYSPASLSHRNHLREPELVMPMLSDLFALAGERLTPGERRSILATRFAKLGRNIYPVMPSRGLGMLLRAAAWGEAPFANLAYVVTACPWLKPLKRLRRRSA